MLNIRPGDILHKSYLNRLLMEIIDRPVMAQSLAFKGESCASMLGYLDRFSVDLDFDVLHGTDEAVLRDEFHHVFKHFDLPIVREHDEALFFQIKYSNDPGKRNTMKISASNLILNANQYRVQYLTEIDRLMNCQTIETMFANKLVAVTDRYDQHQTVAGRDIYDIHYFFTHGYFYHPPVIQERTGLAPARYLEKLIEFIKENVTQTILNEDLNTLLPPEQFQQIRKILIPETLSLLSKEQKRLDL